MITITYWAPIIYQVLFYGTFHVWHNLIQQSWVWVSLLTHSTNEITGLQKTIYLTQVYLATEHKLFPEPDLSDTCFITTPYSQGQSENEISYQMTVGFSWGWFGPRREPSTISEYLSPLKEGCWHLTVEARHVAIQGTEQPPQPRINQSHIPAEIEKPCPWPYHHQKLHHLQNLEFQHPQFHPASAPSRSLPSALPMEAVSSLTLTFHNLLPLLLSV